MLIFYDFLRIPSWRQPQVPQSMLCRNAVDGGVVIFDKRNDIFFPFSGGGSCIVRLPLCQCKWTWSWKSFPTSAIISSQSNDDSLPKTNDISCFRAKANAPCIFLTPSRPSPSSRALSNSLNPLVDLFSWAQKIHQMRVVQRKITDFHVWNLLCGGVHREYADSLKDCWNRSQWISILALIDYNKEKTLWFQLVWKIFSHFKQHSLDS